MRNINAVGVWRGDMKQIQAGMWNVMNLNDLMAACHRSTPPQNHCSPAAISRPGHVARAGRDNVS